MGPGPMQHLHFTKLTSTTTDSPLSFSLCASTSPDFYFLLNLLMSLPWLQPFNSLLWSLSHPRCCSLLVITDISSLWLLSFSACPTLSASAIMLTLGCCTFIISLSLTYFHVSLLLLVFFLPFSLGMSWRAIPNSLLCPLWKGSTGCSSDIHTEHPVHSMQISIQVQMMYSTWTPHLTLMSHYHKHSILRVISSLFC